MRSDCAGSSRTTGTRKACEAEVRRTVVARTVMARLSVLVAGLAEAAARRAVDLSCVGVHEVDQRGVHDSRNSPTARLAFSGGQQASTRCSSGLLTSGSRTPRGGCPNPPGRRSRRRSDAIVSVPEALPAQPAYPAHKRSGPAPVKASPAGPRVSESRSDGLDCRRRAEPSGPGPSCGSGRPVYVPDVVHELLATERALKKLGARSISSEEVGQLPRNAHETIRNPRGPGTRRLLIGRTNGGRALTLVIEQTTDPTTWLVVTGWSATLAERRILRR
jgi:hypothetical protein